MSLLPQMVASTVTNNIPDYYFARAGTGTATSADQFIATGTGAVSGFIVDSVDSNNFVAMAQEPVNFSCYGINNLANVPRWSMGVANLESTADAGSDLVIRSFQDNGAPLGTPLTIVRATGQVVTAAPGGLLVSQGDVVVTAGSLTASGAVSATSISTSGTVVATGSITGAGIIGVGNVESEFVELTSGGTFGVIQPVPIRNGIMINASQTYVPIANSGASILLDFNALDAGWFNSLLSITNSAVSVAVSATIVAYDPPIEAFPLGGTLNITLPPSTAAGNNPMTLTVEVLGTDAGGVPLVILTLDNTVLGNQNTQYTILHVANAGLTTDWILFPHF